MQFGRQYHWCPNCGKEMYDTKLSSQTTATTCSLDCIREWELKYARFILGKDAPVKEGE